MHAPIIQNMIDTNAYPVVGLDTLDDFTSANPYVVLFFSELMKPVPEAADVAVILPELQKAFAGRFAVAVEDHISRDMQEARA